MSPVHSQPSPVGRDFASCCLWPCRSMQPGPAARGKETPQGFWMPSPEAAPAGLLLPAQQHKPQCTTQGVMVTWLETQPLAEPQQGPRPSPALWPPSDWKLVDTTPRLTSHTPALSLCSPHTEDLPNALGSAESAVRGLSTHKQQLRSYLGHSNYRARLLLEGDLLQSPQPLPPHQHATGTRRLHQPLLPLPKPPLPNLPQRLAVSPAHLPPASPKRKPSLQPHLF